MEEARQRADEAHEETLLKTPREVLAELQRGSAWACRVRTMAGTRWPTDVASAFFSRTSRLPAVGGQS